MLLAESSYYAVRTVFLNMFQKNVVRCCLSSTGVLFNEIEPLPWLRSMTCSDTLFSMRGKRHLFCKKDFFFPAPLFLPKIPTHIPEILLH